MEEHDRKRTVRTFAAASFLNDFGSDMIYPIWPLFLTIVLGANMAVLGFIDGLGDAVVSISQAVSGYASDRLKRRKVFVWTGYLFGATSRIGYAVSSAWQHLIPFRILDRAGKMRGAPRDAMLGDASTNADRGRNFGLLRSMDNLGAVAGILVCIAVVTVMPDPYRLLFLIAALPSVVSALLILIYIKEKRQPGTHLFKGLSLHDLDVNFRIFLVLSALFATGAFSYSFLLIFAKQAGYQTAILPVLYLLFTVVAALFSYPFGIASDLIGRKKVIAIAFALWLVVCLLCIYFQSLIAILGVFILYGLHKAALEPVQRTFVFELAPPQLQASTLGGYQMVVGLCALPASLLAGLLWEIGGVAAPFSVSAILTISSLLLLFFVKEKEPRKRTDTL